MITTTVRIVSRPVLSYAVAAALLGSVSTVASAGDNPRPAPRLPVADAGPDVSARVSVPVTLDGSASHGNGARGGDLITFQWAIAQAPAGSTAAIDAASPAPVFVPDKPGVYAMDLVVTDAAGLRSAPDEVTVVAYDGNAPPDVRVGRRRAGAVGSPLTLDASPSFDPEGGELTFLWWLVSAPQGSRLTSADISFSDTANPVFTPDVAGTYVLQLQASDGNSINELRVIVSAIARELPVFADAGPNQRVRPGEVVHLSGQGSGAFSWTVVARPAVSVLTSASIRGADRASAELTPDAAGYYVCRLEASDGRQVDGDNVLILVKENAKPRAAPDAAATWVYSTVDIDVLANDSDPDGDPLTVLAVEQGSQGTVEIRPNGVIRYRPSLGAVGPDTFRYTVGDGHGGTDTATVTVTVSTLPPPLVESFSPASGLVGDLVTLTGANLASVSGVKFAGIAARFTVLSSTQVRAVVPEGARSGPITVLSPEGSFTTAKSFSLAPVVDFALSASPTSLRLRVGEQGALQVTLRDRGTVKSAATLSVAGLPPGVTAKFVVAKLSVGHSTTLTIEVGKDTPNGSYPLLVTATFSSGGTTITRSTSAVLEVFGAPVQGTPVVCGGADLSGVNSSISVSTLGQDGPGCGVSWATACATIAQGIANCNVPCAVLVRHGRYRTSATIETIALKDGVNVYGGCSLGEPPNNFRTVIEAGPAPPGTPALSATNINNPTLVYGIVVVGKDETAAGAASIAMAVTNSKGLTLSHSVLVAGRGGDGGAGGTPEAQPGGAGQGSGQSPGGSGAGAGPNCPSNRVSTAGDGGNGGNGLQGELAFPYFCFFTCPCGYPNLDASKGKTGNASGSSAGGAGGDRAYGGHFCTGPATGGDFDGKGGGFGLGGPCGTLGGTASASVFGSAKGAAWVPGEGGEGGPGSVGAGGGGGASGGYCVGFPDGIHPAFVNGYPGGGGGGGGCGGVGGFGGLQGGASIALMLVNSTVAGVPSQNSLVPGPGGTGGTGGRGGAGGAGGTGGPGAPAGPTHVSGFGIDQLCPAVSGSGGPGGQGGAGSGGAGGNGGPSIGIALVSGSPNPGTSGIYLGLPGAPGAFGPGGRNAAQPVVQPNPCKAADGSIGVGGGTGAVVNLDNPVNDILTSGQVLGPGDSRKSASGAVEFIMQPDSNLCLYKGGVFQWCSETKGSGARVAIMQTDGNLCLRPSLGGDAIWCSNTYGHPGAYLRVTDDGHVVIQDGAFEIWRKP